MISDPRVHTRRWASKHPIYMGLIFGAVLSRRNLGDRRPLRDHTFAIAIGAIFTLTAFGERRRQRKTKRIRK